MKKNFFEKIQRYVPFVFILILFYLAIEYTAGVLLALLYNDIKQIVLRAVIVLVAIIGIPTLSKDILPYMDYLTVSESYIERHCLFRKKQRIYYDNPDCRIGVDIIPPHPRYHTKDEARAWIYISTEPYPDDKIGKITELKNTKNFIKFVYSKKLAETIIEAAPENKVNELLDFYNKTSDCN